MGPSMDLMSFSDEVLINIADHLFLPDLSNFASANRRLLNVCAKTVAEHKSIRKRYHSIYGHRAKFGSWLFPLVWALRDRKIAYYIQHICISSTVGGDICWDLLRSEGRAEETVEMIRSAMKQSTLYSMVDRVGHKNDFDRIIRGNDDTILSLLLALLPNLRRITLPAYHNNTMMDLTRTISKVREISAHSQGQFPNHMEINGVTPLANVVRVDGYEDHGREGEQLDEVFVGVELEYCAGFLTLPAVRTAKLLHPLQLHFEWPEGLPVSHVEEVVVSAGKVSGGVVEMLASNIAGPCIIRQEQRLECNVCEACRSNAGKTCFCDWQSLEIPHKGASPSEWIKTGAYWQSI